MWLNRWCTSYRALYLCISLIIKEECIANVSSSFSSSLPHILGAKSLFLEPYTFELELTIKIYVYMYLEICTSLIFLFVCVGLLRVRRSLISKILVSKYSAMIQRGLIFFYLYSLNNTPSSEANENSKHNGRIIGVLNIMKQC